MMDLSSIPSLVSLQDFLAATLRSPSGVERQVDVLERRLSPFSTRFSTEIVTCCLDGTEFLHLLLKYGTGSDRSGFGHRGGVSYESGVYRHVLQPFADSTAKFYGSYEGRSGSESWLVMEYLEDAVRFTKSSHPERALLDAAKWIARFHAQTEGDFEGKDLYLNRYDVNYFAGWARRTAEYADHWHQKFPWLSGVCINFETIVLSLLNTPRSIVHGEYYPQNVLLQNGVIYPVDWESAAIGPGEIDLAALTEKWPAEIVEQCEQVYVLERWPNGATQEFEHTLSAARMYLAFRWLGDRPEWTIGPQSAWRFHHLHDLAQQTGWI